MTPAEKISAILNRLNWSREDFGKWIDAPPGTVGAWAGGVRTPSRAAMEKVDALYEASQGYGYGGASGSGVGVATLDSIEPAPKPGQRAPLTDRPVDALLKLGFAAFVGWLLLKEEDEEA
jgi:hypothetical protein